MCQADWDRLQYYSRKVKFFDATGMFDNDLPQVHPLTYFRIAQLQSSALFPSLRHLRYNLGETSNPHIFLFLSPLLDSIELIDISGFEDTVVWSFFATLSPQMLSRIVLRTGEMSADSLKRSISHFKQLRSLELVDAVFMSDFAVLEVLGTLPSLEKFTLTAIDPHPVHAPEKSSGQSEGPSYFVALESLCVTGSFFLIQHVLGFIDSPWLKSIEIYPVVDHVRINREPDDLFTPSTTIVASKWAQSLKNLVIGSWSSAMAHRNAILKCLTDLHEMERFILMDWELENIDDDVRQLVMSWPKLRTLGLPLDQKCISMSTLRIIAENCPKLRRLQVRLDISVIPPFDTTGRSLHHKLEVLTLGRSFTRKKLESQIKVTQHLDLIFPYLEAIEVQPNDKTWSGIRDLLYLCQNASRRRVE